MVHCGRCWFDWFWWWIVRWQQQQLGCCYIAPKSRSYRGHPWWPQLVTAPPNTKGIASDSWVNVNQLTTRTTLPATQHLVTSSLAKGLVTMIYHTFLIITIIQPLFTMMTNQHLPLQDGDCDYFTLFGSATVNLSKPQHSPPLSSLAALESAPPLLPCSRGVITRVATG